MYFCPCSCSKSDTENEEDVLIFLPRNLSYVGESYLDRYSVSSAYVHNAKLEKQRLSKDVGAAHCMKTGAAASAELLRLEQRGEKEEGEEKRHRDLNSGEDTEREELLGAHAMADLGSTCTADGDTSHASFRSGGGPDNCDVGMEATMSLPVSSSSAFRAPQGKDYPHLHHHHRHEEREQQQSDFERYVQKVESPDSDMVSEEGVFVNMTDDLDGLEGGNGKSTLSEASDDTYVSGDSMYYSPEEVEGMESEDELRLSLEEAVNKAASTFYSDRRRHHEDDDHNHPPAAAPDAASGDPQSARDGEEHEEPDNREGPQVTIYASDDVEKEPKVTECAEDSQTGEVKSGGDATGHDDSPDSKSKESDAEDSESKQGDAAQAKPEDTKCETEESGSTTKDTGSGSAGATDTPTDSGAGSQEQKASPSPSRASPETGDVKKTQNAKITGLKITLNDGPFRTDERGLSSSYKDLVSPESPLYEDREFNFPRSELRKSTSLKSSKTPPGTPRRKKVVRFADAMGLDLESVRHILNLESPPKIPASAMKDLQFGMGEDRKGMGTKFIVETFQQPGADMGFRERVMCEKVALENALIVSGSITGVVRVANISFHKSVRVRYTINGWATFHDISASYMVNSNDGSTDRFSFTIVPPYDFGPGSKLEFAVSFNANGSEFWDNNRGANYGFECFAKTIPTEAENAWMHFL
ncbi:uncharacterized protein [Littorina saxatilis]|uniref:uncharacterized protein n=1 Tax=Littorina saxatilis TaxID=31220 RepID=UPI0038B458B3